MAKPTNPRLPRKPKSPGPASKKAAPWGFIDSDQLAKKITAVMLPRWQKGAAKTLYFGDGKYYCPPLNEALGLLESGRSEFLKWTKNIFDCDDFAFVLKAHFCRSAFHNGQRTCPYCFGIVWKNKPIRHAMNWIVYRDRNPKTGGGGQFVFALVEPQNIGQPGLQVIRPVAATDGDFYFVTA